MYPFFWHYCKTPGNCIDINFDGKEYTVKDIVLHIDLRKNPMGSKWHEKKPGRQHQKQPTLTVNGMAKRIEIINEVAHIY